jgi:hypothetical protein
MFVVEGKERRPTNGGAQGIRTGGELQAPILGAPAAWDRLDPLDFLAYLLV